MQFSTKILRNVAANRLANMTVFDQRFAEVSRNEFQCAFFGPPDSCSECFKLWDNDFYSTCAVFYNHTLMFCTTYFVTIKSQDIHAQDVSETQIIRWHPAPVVAFRKRLPQQHPLLSNGRRIWKFANSISHRALASSVSHQSHHHHHHIYWPK